MAKRFRNTDCRCTFPFALRDGVSCHNFDKFKNGNSEFLADQGYATMNEYCAGCNFWDLTEECENEEA